MDLWANRPWEHADRLFVPDWQHYSAVNDRFAYGVRALLHDYIEARWRRMQAPAIRCGEIDPPPPATLVRHVAEGRSHLALALAWGLMPPTEYPECLIAEYLVCWYVTTRNTRSVSRR